MSENALGKADSSTDSSDKDFSCEYCGDNFVSQTTKRRHEKKFHAEQLPHECPDCGKAFHGRRGLSSHHAQMHDGKFTGFEQTCELCGCDFTSETSDRKYCSPNCRAKAQRDRVTIECEWCDSTFETKSCLEDERRFCSNECKNEWQSDNFSGENSPVWVERVTRNCKQCGEEFETLKSEDQVFCCEQCHYDWRSENWVGEDNPLFIDSEVECEVCGETFQKRPAKIEMYEKNFCSRECHGEWISENLRGENHPRWQGGKVDYGENWYEQRRKALDRDNHTCQACGKDDTEAKRIHVHHITPRRDFDDFEKANRVENLVCLCMPCHSKCEGRYHRPYTR